MSSPEKNRNLRWSVSALLLATLVTGGLAWSSRSPSEASVPVPASSVQVAAEPRAARVEAVRARRADLPVRVEATGYLEPWRKVEVRADLAGRVVQRSVEEGGAVAAGALLVRLDDREHLVALEEARAELLKSQAFYAVNYEQPAPRQVRPAPAAANDEIQRLEKLVEEGLLPRRSLDDARRRAEADRLLTGSHQGEVRAVTSGVVQAEQRVERGRLVLERTRILAPFAGRVADLAVEAGQQVGPGDALMTLLQDDRLKVDVDVLEADIVRIRQGAPARVRIPSADGLVLEGAVHTINPRIDPETGTGRVTVAIPNPRRLLLTGLFTAVELEAERLPDRLVVPASALLVRQGRDLVFRIEEGRAVWTYVQVGRKAGGLAEVLDGLSPGDIVATGGHFSLAHEAPVEAVLAEEAKATLP